MRSLITAALQTSGHEIVEANDGEEGWRLFQQGSFDAVVTDLQMPKMTGHELIRRIREQDWKCPIVVSTADVQESSRRECCELRVNGFLPKPFKPLQLINMVGQSLHSDQTGLS